MPTDRRDGESSESVSIVSWMEQQFVRARRGLLDSISASRLTKRRPGLHQVITPATGSVIAAPTIADDDRPDYFFHWLRDSALVIDALGLMIARLQEPAPQTAQLCDFVEFSLELNHLSGSGLAHVPGIGHTSDPSLAPYVRSARELAAVEGDHVFGEARYNPDATLDLLKWSRPQFDGPALRALAVMRWLHLIEAFDPKNAKEAEYLIRADLGYLLRHFEEPCFDLWEERFGHHYHTRLVVLAAFEAGAAWASAKSLPEEAEACRSAARVLAEVLQHHWSPRRGIYLAAIKGAKVPDSDRDLDSAVLLAVLHAHRASGRHSLLDPRLHATLAALNRFFAAEFPINRQRGVDEGVLLGRFKDDGYYGGGAFVVLCLGAAEFYYRTAGALRGGAVIAVTQENHGFLTEILETDPEPPSQVPGGDTDRASLVEAFTKRGDDVMRAFRRYMPASGDLSEQIDKATGAPASAHDLAWSYAALIRVFEARRRFAAGQ